MSGLVNLDWSKRTHKGLRRWVLLMLKDNPRNGAEIMDTIEAMSQGWWRPSPGSIYPLLDGLLKEGLLVQLPNKRYQLTERGREELESPFGWFGVAHSGPRSVEDVLEEISNQVKYLEDLAGTQEERVRANSARIRQVRERLEKMEKKTK